MVVGLERLDRVRSLEAVYRGNAHLEAGVTTGRIHKLARENGVFYPPDPGASEQSQLGGNIACNAGGPHSFKYGVTGDWVTAWRRSSPAASSCASAEQSVRASPAST